MSKIYMWEILVPVRFTENTLSVIPDSFHKQWDTKVLEISKGLTILKPAKGQWISPSGKFYADEMIPVRIACTQKQFHGIIKLTLDHYKQEAVMGFKFGEQILCTRSK